MKKSLFSLGEIIPSNNNKNRKGMNIAKTKEKENKKIQQFYINKNKKKSIQKQLKQDINLNYNSKTPIKISGKTKLNNLKYCVNECNKNNNNNNILSSSTNGKQIFLLEFFLKNNNKDVKHNTILINNNKIKNLNKVAKSLLPMKKNNKNKLKNTRYFNRNSNTINQLEKMEINKNVNKIINMNLNLKEIENKKDEDLNNNKIIYREISFSKDNIHNYPKHQKEEKEENIKTTVNLSTKKNEKEKTSLENSKNEFNIIKTPMNIFKNKIMNILNNNIYNIDNNEFNKSDNLVLYHQNKRKFNNKNIVKSNSLEKDANHKHNFGLLSTKSLFNLTKVKKINQSDHSFLVINKKQKNENNDIKILKKKKLRDTKSCDDFFQKKSTSHNKINLKLIRNKKEKEIIKPNNLLKYNGNNKKNYFNSAKVIRKFKKHKSLDIDLQNSLNRLIISQKEIKDLLEKRENKTPEKISQTIIFPKDNNQNTNKKITNYIYHIIPGNNRKLIERCLLNRGNWLPSSGEKKEFSNLFWSPLSSQINFTAHELVENCQLVNHFEYHNELTNKSKTFINLLRYCEFNDIDLFGFYPLTIIFTFNSNSFNLQIDKFKKLYNDIPNLLYNEKKEEQQKPIYNEYFSANLSRKLGSFQKIQIPQSHYAGKNLWLLKRDNLNRGRKIKVFSNLDSILKEINTLYEQRFPNNLIIQKYIENPLLYNKRKFDIRIWVLFTFLDKDKKYEVFIFKEGHLKACSDEFNLNSDDLFIHLTNYSVQKHNKNFSKSEIGNEISFSDFQKELNKSENKVDFKKQIFPEIIKIVSITANSIKGKINLSKRTNCFEIFGYDFILDINYKPFLLEINTNPGYEESSPLIKTLVPRMIDDALRLTIDKEFEVYYKSNNKKSNYFVEGYPSSENMWLKIKTIL